jgi:plastocyanin
MMKGMKRIPTPQVTKFGLSAWLLSLLLINPLFAAVHVVTVQDNSFSPATVVIEAGDTVRWENNGPSAHNIYAVGKFRCANGCEAEGGNGNPSSDPWVAEITFRVPETIPYECQPHVGFGMVGTVVVNQPDTVAAEITANPDNSYSPAELTVVEGQRVYFSNAGGEHNIHSTDESLICADGCEGDGLMVDTDPTGFPWEFYHLFTSPGTVSYQCDNPAHTSQTGVIHVLSEVIFANGFD